jgi:transcriptional regulator with XRE-family HTH domain
MLKNRVRQVAEPRGYTMTRLAKETGISFNTIKRLWKNPNLGGNIDTLNRIAKVLHISLSDLFEEVPDD